MYIPFSAIIAIVLVLLWQGHNKDRRKREEEERQAEWARKTGSWRNDF